MNPNWLGVVSGILAVVAFGAIYQRAKRSYARAPKMAFVFISGGIFAALLPRLLLVISLLGIVWFSITLIAEAFIGPIQDGTLKDEGDSKICPQSFPSTCCAASMATILKYLGVDVTESELVAEAHLYAG